MLQSADLAGDGAWDIDLLFLGERGGVVRESGLGCCTVVSGEVCLCMLGEEGSGGGAGGVDTTTKAPTGVQREKVLIFFWGAKLGLKARTEAKWRPWRHNLLRWLMFFDL